MRQIRGKLFVQINELMCNTLVYQPDIFSSGGVSAPTFPPELSKYSRRDREKKKKVEQAIILVTMSDSAPPDTMATEGILLNRAHDKSGP